MDEAKRIAALRSYDVLDDVCDTGFQRIATLTSLVLGCPVALVSLVDSERQCFLGRVGVDATETPRDVSFCAHAILRPRDLLIVPDIILDPRFSDNPVASELGLRFYAGAPLVNAEGAALGTLCVVDTVPRTLSEEQQVALRYLADTVVTTLELRRATRDVRAAAMADTLTGIANRPALLEALRRAIALQQRDGTPFSLIYLDLDGFKQVNDHHGHASGDCVLREVATVLTEMARASDLPARIGGDEFVVLLAGREVDTAAAAHRYCQRIEATMKRNGWSVTASIGAVSFPVAPADVEEALCAADALMYNAKASGKNRVLHQEFTDRQIAPGARRACV